jgi:hypothetical protein
MGIEKRHYEGWARCGPVADLELVDHDGHAHLVLLGEVVEVAEHTLVHGCRRRRRTARKARVWGRREDGLGEER